MKKITPVVCTIEEYKKIICLEVKPENECRIRASDEINSRKRKLIEIPNKIVSVHNNGKLDSYSISRSSYTC